MAAPEEKLPQATQESIATCVALVDDDNSRIVSSVVEASLFDPPFDEIVSRCLEYRKKYKKPPGKQHIDDVFSDILEDDEHKDHGIMVRLIGQMIRLAENIDTKFIMSRAGEFVRLKQMRAGIARAAERYQKGGPGIFDDLESIFRQTLRIRDKGLDYGFSLADGDRALAFLDQVSDPYRRLKLDIPQLDEHGVQPAKKELLLFLAARNRGKSQFLHWCGRQALRYDWRVVHYTLENSEEMTAMRYFQTLYSGVRRDNEGGYYFAEFDDSEGPVRLRPVKLKPNFIMSDKDGTSAYLHNKIRRDPKLANIRIRAFPTGQLSYDMLERDLDELEIVHKFVPDLVLVDYPQIMKLPRAEKDYTALQHLTINLRGLAVERDMAVVIPQQGNRASERAGTVRGDMGGGSIEMLAIADNAITYSQTASEEEHGLARLFAQKVRNDSARFTVCISQHYPSGMFCMGSWYMTNDLKEQVKKYVGYSEGEAEEGDEDFDEQRKLKRAR